MELQEVHRYAVHRNLTKEIVVGHIVLVHDEKLPKGLWKLGKSRS